LSLLFNQTKVTHNNADCIQTQADNITTLSLIDEMAHRYTMDSVCMKQTRKPEMMNTSTNTTA